jgi:hypothetical protein
VRWWYKVLKDYVPPFLLQSLIFQKLYSSQQIELDNLDKYVQEIMDQCFIDTATWGLDIWERFCGLPISSNKPVDERRSTIKSRVRGYGTITKAMLQNLLKAYPGGSAEIIEDVLSSKFTVKFNDYYRVPDEPSIPQMYKALDIVKPAHLVYDHTFTYKWWGFDQLKVKTWNEVGSWGSFRTYEEV